MDIRSLQRPLKDAYRQDPASSRITLVANGRQTDAPISCSVDLGRAIYDAQAHKGVGGAGTGACSGDLLLGALAACAQITCQMVAAAMGIPTDGIEVTVEGDLDLQGTLGMSKTVPVGFENYKSKFRCPCAESNAGTVDGSPAKNRAVLCCHSNIAASSSNQERVGKCAVGQGLVPSPVHSSGCG